MESETTMSMLTRVAKHLRANNTGSGISVGKLAQLTGTTKTNVQKRVSDLLNVEGHTIYTNKRNGKTFYRIANRKPQTSVEIARNAFMKGEELTVKQLRARGVTDPSDVVRALREQGYAIYSNQHGNVVKYRLGTPSRAMIAAAYAAAGSSLFA